MLVFSRVTFFTDIFEKLKSLHTLRQTLWSITALIPQMCLLPSHTLSLKIITDHSIKYWKVAVCTWYDLQRFWWRLAANLQSSLLQRAWTRAEGLSWACAPAISSMCQAMLLAQGLHVENPHHTLKMQQGNSLEQRGIRHRLQKQRESKSKAKNKCLWMHRAWPVTPITLFFCLFSIFKRDCFPRTQTPHLAGGTGLHVRQLEQVPMLPALLTNFPGPWDLNCWVSLGRVSPKQPDATLCSL